MSETYIEPYAPPPAVPPVILPPGLSIAAEQWSFWHRDHSNAEMFAAVGVVPSRGKPSDWETIRALERAHRRLLERR